MVFYINKTKIKLEYSFLLIFAFALLMKSRDILYVLVYSSIHELAHLIALVCFKGRAKQITLAFYGIGLKYDYSFAFAEELIFLLSGVLINLILGVLNCHREINYSLAFINILPLYPLDGGRALKLILNKAFSMNVSDKFFSFITICFITALIIYSVSAKNVSLILIIFYILVFSFNNRGFYD